MNWKITSGVLAVAVALLGYQYYKAHKTLNPLAAAPGTTGPAIGDPRGNRTLAIQQTLLGPKAVAEGAKQAQLGETLTKDREEAKKRRAA